MATTNDSKAPVRQVKRVQFGILSPDEIVSNVFNFLFRYCLENYINSIVLGAQKRDSYQLLKWHVVCG